ncbi:D-tyrosyl-tRNA(Tyr) deacylase [Spizellomyces punctatus DAOM BR117]|uniref:D-aminoacyl-tRNA deacylase n=1 Tax=Spizellomyces punctatus (strain DAOM BR117) TaxID=645134 RepID=A0A0L0HAY2_SPIPD|nr:D-tyrosyl-tRNA(Tyr) deacylase [Spizellomyces punctatus DAOM BR117]KNC98362.1 D-tyrosyl-tRNA(Tyr) deacylase [Spizellomyces punctatus DAOM BR117]|eukprot:XP_016606402.1 D-tyrosyl-tRNA(Tyr) deacylase [Spizellomyces punctatus DAOM BR117]
MRAILQRVSSASVTVNGEIVGKIGKGICVLIGISGDDEGKDVNWMVKKLTSVRVFEDGNGKPWTKSVKDLDLEILSVSQFTLYALSNKGSKPDFHLAMKSDQSKDMYTTFLEKLKAAYKPERVQDGVFGAMMQVNILNDGPVTLILDSRDGKKNGPNGTSTSSS